MAYFGVSNEYAIPVVCSSSRICRIPFTSLADLESKTRHQTGGFEKGSWEDMLLCVPAIDEVDVCFTWGNTGEVNECTVKDAAGVKMKEVVDMIRKTMGSARERIRDVAGDSCLLGTRRRGKKNARKGVGKQVEEDDDEFDLFGK
jgi:hypothetical protein